MKTLFCSQTYLSKTLGGSKIIIELAEEFERLGWQTDIISPAHFAPPGKEDIYSAYPENLRRHLLAHAHEYDVVDYDHVYLPYQRTEFHKDALFVARSVLLVRHFETIRIPRSRGLKAVVRSLVKGRREKRKVEAAIRQADRTLEEADLINVPNTHDKVALLRLGIPESKIVVIPNGIDRVRLSLFNAISSEPPDQPTVAFVGTFDNRKGATDFPAIINYLIDEICGVRFRLMGTSRTEAEVLKYFDKSVRRQIEVIPRYEVESLPELLAPCSIGMFPSYVEGFGLGVLEMLAASIPVIAYDSPGPPMMLPADYLVRAGDAKGLARKVTALLRSPDELAHARRWAKERSRQFCWEEIANRTEGVYREHLERKRAQGRDEAARNSRRAS